MRGSEEHFNLLAAELAKNTRAYEEKKIKHYQWADSVDRLFESYGWSKEEFYKELNKRLGVETNESRRAEPEEKKKKKVRKKRIAPPVGADFD